MCLFHFYLILTEKLTIDKIWDFQASGTQEDVLICDFLFSRMEKLNVKGYESPDEIVSRLTCQCIKNVLIQMYVFTLMTIVEGNLLTQYRIQYYKSFAFIFFFRKLDEYRIQ